MQVYTYVYGIYVYICMYMVIQYICIYVCMYVSSGLYFAITSCSTAGLYGPYCADPGTFGTARCDVGARDGLFVGCYVLLGVPCMYVCMYVCMNISYVMHASVCTYVVDCGIMHIFIYLYIFVNVLMYT